MTPAPTTTNFLGIVENSNAPSLSKMTSLSTSIPEKFLGDEPVAIMIFLASISWFPFSPMTSMLFFFYSCSSSFY
jgi:hypothetical protein